MRGADNQIEGAAFEKLLIGHFLVQTKYAIVGNLFGYDVIVGQFWVSEHFDDILAVNDFEVGVDQAVQDCLLLLGGIEPDDLGEVLASMGGSVFRMEAVICKHLSS